MKKAFNIALVSVLLLAGLSYFAGAGPAGYLLSFTGNTEELVAELQEQYGLTVHFGGGAESLPKVWQMAPFSGEAKPTEDSCVSAFMPVIHSELKKYRPEALKANLENLYLFESLTLFGVSYGATVESSDVYLTIDCKAGYTRTEVAKALHHELSSVFLRASQFPTDAWTAVNNDDSRYMDNDKQVLDAVAMEQDLSGSPQLYRQGFLASYGKTTIENDINLYAEVALVEPGRLKVLAEEYTKIDTKARILKEFYQSFVPEGALDY